MPRRLFVIWNSPLFHKSVRLLVEHPDVEWVGTTSDYEKAKDQVLALEPDTILVEEIDGLIPATILDILETSTYDFRLIGISLLENKITIYRCEQREVTRADDLIHLILQ